MADQPTGGQNTDGRNSNLGRCDLAHRRSVPAVSFSRDTGGTLQRQGRQPDQDRGLSVWVPVQHEFRYEVNELAYGRAPSRLAGECRCGLCLAGGDLRDTVRKGEYAGAGLQQRRGCQVSLEHVMPRLLVRKDTGGWPFQQSLSGGAGIPKTVTAIALCGNLVVAARGENWGGDARYAREEIQAVIDLAEAGGMTTCDPLSC